MRLKTIGALGEYVLLLLGTGEFLSKVYRPRSSLAIFYQSLDWRKDSPKGVNLNRMNTKKMAVTYIYLNLWGIKDKLENTLKKLEEEKDILPPKAHLYNQMWTYL